MTSVNYSGDSRLYSAISLFNAEPAILSTIVRQGQTFPVPLLLPPKYGKGFCGVMMIVVSL